MLFISILLVVTLAIAASAAFFSVFGLTSLFVGVFIPILIMGSALEAGKLIAASFLYRFWGKITFFIKAYLIASVLILMLITSVGIFGYLTAAYQRDTIPLKELTQRIETNQIELDRLTERKKEIDKQIAELPHNYVTARQNLMRTFKPELDALGPRIDELLEEISKDQSAKLATEAHVGPILFVAKVLDRDPDDAVFYFTLLIMIVFDPLAVALTLATNMAIKERSERLSKLRNVSEEPVDLSQEANMIIKEKESSAAVDEDHIKGIINSEMKSQHKRRELIAATR